MKYESKTALISDIEREFIALTAILDSIPLERYLESGVWGDNWNVRDLIAHLFEWQQFFLRWFDVGNRALIPAIPAEGFAYSETPRLNRTIQARYADRDPTELRSQLEESHRKILILAKQLTEKQLLDPGHFAWTKKNALVTYLGANTASHYRFAMKVLRRWLQGGVRRKLKQGKSAKS